MNISLVRARGRVQRSSNTFAPMTARFLPLLGLLLAAPIAGASDSAASAYLLKADNITVQPGGTVLAVGHPALVAKTGVRFTAEQIVFDPESATVTLSGGVMIHAIDRSTIAVKQLTIDAKGKRVMMLSGGKTEIVRGPASGTPETTAIEFTQGFPATELKLRRAGAKP
jgi:hypothetical protein